MAIPKHKKNLDIGNKTTTYGPKLCIEQEDAASFESNEEITFMDWGNAYVLKHPSSETPVKKLDVQLHLEGDFKKTSKKVHWLAISSSAPLVNILLKEYDYLITKKKIEEDEEWTDFINPETEFLLEAYADWNVREVKRGDIIQFERKGFYICDKALQSENDTMEFIMIPDGKAASVSLKAKPATAKKRLEMTLKRIVNGESHTTSALPEQAPNTAQSATLHSRGMQIPVTTKVSECKHELSRLSKTNFLGHVRCIRLTL